jgi:hypothetical protein
MIRQVDRHISHRAGKTKTNHHMLAPPETDEGLDLDGWRFFP